MSSKTIIKPSKEVVEAMQKRFDHAKKNTGLPWALQCVKGAVEGIGKKVIKEQDGQLRVTCPCHAGGNENNPSLYVKYNPDTDKTTLKCFVCKAVDKDQTELWNDSLAVWGIDSTELTRPKPDRQKPVAFYDYVDESGNLLYQRVKLDPKGFFFQRPNQNKLGEWIPGIKNIRRVLYNLPALLRAETSQVVFCEGEKDVNTLTEHGYMAVTSGDTNSWRPEFAEFFRDKDVVVVPDEDKEKGHIAGLKFANKVAADVFKVANSTKLIRLPFGEDVSEYFAGKGTTELLSVLMSATPKLNEAPVVDIEVSYHLTDQGNAKRFAAEHSDRLRYNRTKGKWMNYDGQRWSYDTGEDVAHQCYAQTADKLFFEAAGCKGDDRKKTLAWANKSESAVNLRGTLFCAKSIKTISTGQEAFDQHPYLLNVLDGTINLRTGQLKPHDPADMISQLAPVNFHYKGRPTVGLWMMCLNRWHNGDKEAIDYLQRLAGYCLTGDMSSRCFPIFFGSGANGKNVFLETLQGILGDYAGTVPKTLLTISRNEEHSTELTTLVGKRLMIASETESRKKLKTGLIKKITGDKTMSARFIRQDHFTFKQTAKIILMTNHLPVISETSDAIWDRIHKIGWNVKIPKPEWNTNLIEELKAEWTGILHWAIEGYRKWQETGILEQTESITRETEEYRASENPVKQFVDDFCITDDGLFSPTAKMRDAFLCWVDEMDDVDSLVPRDFNAAMRGLGYASKVKRVDGVLTKCWIDIGLQPHVSS